MEGLGLNVSTLVAQLVTFILLFLLLRIFAYKPMLKMLDERSKRVKDSMEETERVRAEAAASQDESKRRIEAGIKEGQELLSRAAKAAEDVRQQAQGKAQEEAQAMISRARGEIQRERDEAVGALRKEFADLTVAAAEKVIDRSLDKNAHRAVIDKVLEEASTLKQR